MSFVLNEYGLGQLVLDRSDAGLIGQDGFLVDYDTPDLVAVRMLYNSVLTVQGTIATDEGAVIASEGSTVLLVGSSGSILAGSYAILVSAGTGSRIANAGLLQSGDATVVFTSAGSTAGEVDATGVIVNSGEITSLSSAAVYSYDMLSTFITNHGLMHGGSAGIETLDDQTVRIVNTGTIQGGQFAIILGGSIGGSISNSGMIDGTVLMGNGADQFLGRSGEQSYVNGRGGNDRIVGGGSDEEIYGDLGNDTLAGNSGEDLLNGGTGNDSLSGGRGDDGLTGGAGSDIFVFSRGNGNDRVFDFADGRDKIDLSAFRFENAAAVVALAANRNGGLLIDLTGEGGGTIFMDGMTLAAFGASDMILA